MKKTAWLVMGLAFVLLILVVRLDFTHLSNAVPIGAFALWAGAYLTKRMAALYVLATLAVSDFLIGGYAWPIMATVYFAALLFIPLGAVASSLPRTWWQKVIAPFVGVGVGSVAFFLLTNIAVWLFGGWYPKTAAGLNTCLVAGLPFWRNSVIGDIYGVAIFFGISIALTTLTVLFRQEALRQAGFCSRS